MELGDDDILDSLQVAETRKELSIGLFSLYLTVDSLETDKSLPIHSHRIL